MDRHTFDLGPLPADADPGAACPAASGHDLQAIVERSSDPVLQTAPDGRITWLNAAARAVLGLVADGSARALRLADIATAATLRQFADEIEPALAAQGHWRGESTLHLAAARDVPFSHQVIAHHGPDGRVVRRSSLLRSMAQEREAQRDLRRHADILRAITEAVPATVVVVDSQGRYRFVNSAFERYCGLPADRILGQPVTQVLGAAEIARRKPFMQRAFAGETVEFQLDYPGPEGVTHTAFTCVPLKLEGLVDGFVGISQDVTRQQREQARLAHLAERDPLTGLLNRAGFESRVERSVRAGQGAAMAMLYIDLDHFKPVNDRHGHLAGDRLLQAFAGRIADLLREGDAAARLGGDEFAILLDGVRETGHALSVAERVLAAAAQPFDLEGRPVRVSASVGLAFGVLPQQGWRELLARADAMLYRAKAAGRAGIACEAR